MCLSSRVHFLSELGSEFLLTSASTVFQVHAVVARVNKETVRGYLAKKMEATATRHAEKEPEALFEEMKSIFFTMFDIKIAGKTRLFPRGPLNSSWLYDPDW